jgi:hypothetical protein
MPRQTEFLAGLCLRLAVLQASPLPVVPGCTNGSKSVIRQTEQLRAPDVGLGCDRPEVLGDERVLDLFRGRLRKAFHRMAGIPSPPRRPIRPRFPSPRPEPRVQTELRVLSEAWQSSGRLRGGGKRLIACENLSGPFHPSVPAPTRFRHGPRPSHGSRPPG